MAITFSNLGASANPDLVDPSDLSSYSNTSWAPPGSGLIVACVYNRRTAAAADLPTMSGNGLTWVQIQTLLFGGAGTDNRMTMFGASASGSSTGATTVSYGGNVQLGCLASFFAVDGADLSGGVAAAFVQAPTNSGVGVTVLSVTLASAGSANNRPISFFWHFAQEGTTERINWVALDDLSTTGPNVGIETQYRPDAFETTASATWTTGSACGGIAAEIKAVAGAGSSVVDPLGMMGFFGG